MRNLCLYYTNATFKAYEQAAGGTGDDVQTVIPGIVKTEDNKKIYFNTRGKTKLRHTVTVNYKSGNGKIIAPSETVSIRYYEGVSQEIVLTPKNVEGYLPREAKKVVTIPRESVVTFVYSPKDVDLTQPLTFKIISGGTISWVALYNNFRKTIEYKKNDGNWTNITSNTGASAPSISVSVGDVIQFRGDNATYGNSSYYNHFSAGTGTKFEVEGNIMSLISSTNFETVTTFRDTYTFRYLFPNCTGLTSAENLILPAKTLVNDCYGDMFQGCTSLTTAPALPATTLTNYCYYDMFRGCTNLIYIKCLATKISAYLCTTGWVGGVASTGTFVKNHNMSSWGRGNNGIPTNWTIQNA